MNEPLLRRITEITSREYGLLRDLAENSYLALQPVEELIQQVVTDRLQLAQEYLDFAASINNTSPFNGRQIISRSYYAMHHAARAVIFETRRRDIRAHEAVATGIAQILGTDASETLSTQHELRNNIEYEVYLSDFDFPSQSTDALNIATAFLQNCQDFIQERRGT